MTAVTAFLMYYGEFITGTYMYYYGKSVGIVAAILVFFQWAPQIWITWNKKVRCNFKSNKLFKEAGALSLSSLIMQAPGSFIVVGFQVVKRCCLFNFKLSAGADWTTWAPYGVAGLQQVFLAGLLTYFFWRDRRNKEHPLVENYS